MLQVHFLCIGAANRQGDRNWPAIEFLRNGFVSRDLDVTVSFALYPSRYVPDSVAGAMTTMVVYSQAPHLVAEAALAAVAASNESARARSSAGGTATMAGPHAHDIHSAGGKAGGKAMGGSAASAEGSSAYAEAKRAAAPVATLSAAEYEKRVRAATEKLKRAWSKAGGHGPQPSKDDGRAHVARNHC